MYKIVYDFTGGEKLIEQFIREERPDADLHRCINLYSYLLTHPTGLIIGLEHEGGQLVGLLCAASPETGFLSTKRSATELMFYILPEHRGRYQGKLMMQELERYARDVWNCGEVVYGCLSGDEKMLRYYKIMGYEPYEVMVRKELK